MARRRRKSEIDPESMRLCRKARKFRARHRMTIKEFSQFIDEPYETVKSCLNLGRTKGCLKWTPTFAKNVARAIGDNDYPDDRSSLNWDAWKDDSEILIARLREKLKKPGLQVRGFRRPVPTRFVSRGIRSKAFACQFAEPANPISEDIQEKYHAIADLLREYLSEISEPGTAHTIDTYMLRKDFENFVYRDPMWHYRACTAHEVLHCLKQMRDNRVRLHLIDDIDWETGKELDLFLAVLVAENQFAVVEDRSHRSFYFDAGDKLIFFQRLMRALHVSATKDPKRTIEVTLQPYIDKVAEEIKAAKGHMKK